MATFASLETAAIIAGLEMSFSNLLRILAMYWDAKPVIKMIKMFAYSAKIQI